MYLENYLNIRGRVNDGLVKTKAVLYKVTSKPNLETLVSKEKYLLGLQHQRLFRTEYSRLIV